MSRDNDHRLNAPAGLGRGVAGLGRRRYVSVRKKEPLPVAFEGIQNMWMTPEGKPMVIDPLDSRQDRAPAGPGMRLPPQTGCIAQINDHTMINRVCFRGRPTSY